MESALLCIQIILFHLSKHFCDLNTPWSQHVHVFQHNTNIVHFYTSICINELIEQPLHNMDSSKQTNAIFTRYVSFTLATCNLVPLNKLFLLCENRHKVFFLTILAITKTDKYTVLPHSPHHVCVAETCMHHPDLYMSCVPCLLSAPLHWSGMKALTCADPCWRRVL